MKFDRKKILSRTSAREMEIRAEEVERLYLAAVSGGGSRIRIKGAPWAGTSELLRVTFDRLFTEQRFIKPFYFALRPEDRTARDAASRFVYEFLLQSVAFERNDPLLMAAVPDIRELTRLAPLHDAAWAKVVGETFRTASDRDTLSLLAAPIRASIEGRFGVCMIIDDLHRAATIEGGGELLQQISSLVVGVGSSLFLAGRRSYPLPGTFDRTITIDSPTSEEAGNIADSIALEIGVEISNSTRDLIAEYSGRRPELIRRIVTGAANENAALAAYRDAARVYASEVVSGGISKIFEAEINGTDELYEALHLAGEPFPLSILAERLDIGTDRFDRLVERLAGVEIIEVSGSRAVRTSDRIARDFLQARYLISQDSTSSAAAARIALQFFTAAPKVMETEYRRAASSDLIDILSAFDGREVPAATLDYRTFRDRYKGLSDADIRAQIADDAATTTLPQVVHAAEFNDLLPGRQHDIDLRLVSAGVGFDDDEIVWIAAEIDSKLEADPGVTREWIDRLKNAAERAEFERYKIWLVAPEGFSPGALEILGERNAVGSSRRQLTFLSESLGMSVHEDDAQEFEMTIPIGDETELIAVHAVEEIARRYDYPAKAINQVKTALVEACINAAEHSLSPDRKIYLKFAFYADRLVATVSNRGLRLADKVREIAAGDEPSSDTRRGWGLGLMRNLMDDVRLERVDDGTRIVMTKLLSA